MFAHICRRTCHVGIKDPYQGLSMLCSGMNFRTLFFWLDYLFRLFLALLVLCTITACPFDYESSLPHCNVLLQCRRSVIVPSLRVLLSFLWRETYQRINIFAVHDVPIIWPWSWYNAGQCCRASRSSGYVDWVVTHCCLVLLEDGHILIF